MNMLQNQKIKTLVDQIETQDLKILHAAANKHEGIIRNILDHRRQLLAFLERELMAQTGQETAFVDTVYSCNEDILNFIKLWCEQIKHANFTPEKLLDEDYCHRVVDAYVPLSWNWAKDLVILIYPSNPMIFNVFAERGQKNIVAICETDCTLSEKDISRKFDNCFVVSDYLELADCISKINTRVRQVTTLHCDPENNNTPEILKNVYEALKLGRKSAQISVNTHARFSSSWSTNILKNLRKFPDCYHLSDLKVGHANCAVVVAPGPSLEKNIHVLKEAKENVLIVTVFRALSILEKHGIKPDLVVQVDALNDVEACFLAENPPGNISNLYLEGSVNPVLFNLKADKKIYSLMASLESVHTLLGTKPTEFTAPSVAIYAAHLCQYLGIGSICLLGQDLAAKNGITYAEGATDNMLDLHSKIPFDIPVPGFWGETVYTRPDFAYYIEQYSILADQWKSQAPDLQLVNATEGGVFIDGFDHMTFRDYLDQQNLKGVTKKKSLFFGNQSGISQSDVELFLKRKSNQLGKIMQISATIVKLDQQPDKDTGTQKKLKKLIKQFSKLNREVEFLELAMQQEITATVGNAKTTSTVPSYAAFFEKVETAAKGLQQTILSEK